MRHLPPEMQDDIARILLLYAGEPQPVILLTPEEEADLAEVGRGEFTIDEEMQAAFANYRLRDCATSVYQSIRS